jgi:hypothetical protein
MQTDKLVAACAVGVVVVAGLAAALLTGRQDASESVVAGAGPVNTSAHRGGVVTAPPLDAPAIPAARNSVVALPRTSANTMGAAPACGDCGVVQLVVAVYEYGQPQPNGYQMHIRMDDGTTRTVQQRGALAAGSRVLLDGETVRVLAEPSRAG